MELCLTAGTGAACAPAADRPSPPPVRLSAGARWQESAAEVTLTVHATPAQAARFIRAGGLEVSGQAPYLFVPSRPAQRGELTVMITAGPGEWAELESAMKGRLSRRADLSQPADMHVEWPMVHPAFEGLRPGDFALGDVHLLVLPDEQRVEVVCEISEQEVAAMTACGYTLHPHDDWQEEVHWLDTLMGVLLKPSDTDNSDDAAPFLLLHGLHTSLAHPSLMRPFPGTVEHVDPQDLTRIITDTMQMADDVDPADFDDEDIAFDEAYQVEYAGIAETDMPMLMHLLLGLTEGLEDRAFDAADAPETFAPEVSTTLLSCLIAGSRVMRATLALAGHDTGMGRELGQRDSMTLLHGLMYGADAFKRAAGDCRPSRIWTLPLAAAVRAESAICEQVMLTDASGVCADDLLASALLSFDLGVRYQLARVAPQLMRATAHQA